MGETLVMAKSHEDVAGPVKCEVESTHLREASKKKVGKMTHPVANGWLLLATSCLVYESVYKVVIVVETGSPRLICQSQ